MIHLIHEVGFHSETVRSLVATFERLDLGYNLYFLDGALTHNRFGLHEFRKYRALNQAADLQQYLTEGDVIFFSTLRPEDRQERWHFLESMFRVSIYGVVHNFKCSAPRSWVRVVLTASEMNSTRGRRVYFQIDRPLNHLERQPTKSFSGSLPDNFFLMVGNLKTVRQITSENLMERVFELPYPLIIVGTGPESVQTYFSGFGTVVPNLDDEDLSSLAKKSDGIVFLGDPGIAPVYSKKISGSFSLAISHCKPLICATEYTEGNKLECGIEIRGTVTKEMLEKAEVKSRTQRSKMQEHNEFVFSRLTKGRNVVIPPTSGMGSLGDEAIVSTIVKRLQMKGMIVSMAFADRRWEKMLPLNPDGSRVECLDEIYGADKVIICGTDMLDERYGSRDKLKSHCEGVEKIYVLGVSAKSTRFFQNLEADVITARDGETLSVLSDFGALECMDPAFLLETSELKKDLAVWLRTRNNIIVGVNFRTLDSVHHWLHLFKENFPGVSIVPIPHDFRWGHPDVKTSMEAIRLARKLDIDVWDGSFIQRASEVKKLTGELDLVMSAKMHLCIASLGSGTPAYLFPYDSKFRELETRFGENVYSSRDGCELDIEPVRLLLERKGKFQPIINEVKELAEKSFQYI